VDAVCAPLCCDLGCEFAGMAAFTLNKTRTNSNAPGFLPVNLKRMNFDPMNWSGRRRFGEIVPFHCGAQSTI
jgi:hypothetical protein